MSYIGQGLPADTFQGFVTDTFAGDGSATTFTLSKEPFSEATLIVVINNVIQKPTTNFTVSGTTLTIVGTAVADGDVIYAIHMGGPLPIGGAAELDLNGASDKLILDADADTTISADTDDQIDFKAGGTDVFQLTGTTATLNVPFNDGVEITTADTSETLTLTSTEAGADNAPILKMYRNSSSPADSDYVGLIKYVMRNDNSQDFIAAQHYGYNLDVSDGTEDGGFAIDVMKAGTVRSILTATGDEIVFNNGSQDIDFRVESDGNANMFKVDAGAEHVNIGASDVSDGDDASFNIEGNTSKYAQKIYQGATGTQGAIRFHNPNGTVGNIHMSGSSTVFATSSDYRLKENVNYSWDATTELKKLKPAKFNFKADASTTLEGFLAHEVADVVPIAVDGEKDAVNDEGKIVPQSIDQSKLVPLMVKTIQELEARIKTLEDA